MTDLLELLRATARDAAEELPPRAGLPTDADAWRMAEAHVSGLVAADPERGDDLVRAYARLAEHAGSATLRGRALRLRASARAHRGEHGAAIPVYRQALVLLRGAARDGARIGLAGSLLRLGRFDEAAAEAREARRAARRRGDGLLASAGSMTLGIGLLESGAPGTALGPLREAVDGFQEAGDPVHSALARESVANALVLLDRWDEAAVELDAVDAAFAAAGLDLEAACATYNRGVLLAESGRVAAATSTLHAAEERLARAGARVESLLARIDRGAVLERAGLLPEALHVVASARTRLGADGPPYERERARLVHARTALRSGDARLAASLLRRAIGVPAPLLAGERDELRGRALLLRGRRRAAEQAFESAVTTYGRRHPAGRTRALCALGWLALEQGDVDAAAHSARRAGRTAARLAHPDLDFAAAALAFDVVRSRGSARRALPALRRALDALERVRGERGGEALRAAVLRGSEAWFGRALRTLLAAHAEPAEAFALLERWRARTLVDLLSTAHGTSSDPDVEDLRRRIAVLEARADDRPVPAFVRGARIAPEATRSALAEAERELAARVAVPSARAGSGSVSDRRAAVPSGHVPAVRDDTLVLSLFEDATGSLVFVLGGHGLDVVALTKPERVRGAVEDLHFQLGAFELGPDAVARRAVRLRRRTDAALAELSRALAPVLERVRDLGVRTLRIAPHGVWQRVPFGALPLPDGRRLQDVVDVALTPSVESLGDPGPVPAGPALVVASADGVAPSIDDETRAVVDALATTGRTVETYVDDRASVAAVRARLRDGARPAVVHVAAHGRFRADLPALSGVRLRDGWLRALDLAESALPGAVVVLSGCETGRVDDTGGEAQGLVRAVLASGARDLVVTLWPVDDGTTARFMAAFHRRLATGVAADAALGATQRAFAAEDLHPWYWAGFTVWTRRLPPR